jgi:hypothetical protein
MIAIMAANRKVNNTTTRSPSWQTVEKLITLINFSIVRHDGDRLLVF